MTTKKGLRIASLAGVPIYVSWSWWFFAALLLVVFRPTFAQALPEASTGWTWAVSAFFVLIMFATVLVHEVAHAIAAMTFRWKVYEITLNFWGGATTYTHSAQGKTHSPLRALTVALVGPLSNLLIAGLTWLLLQLLLDPTGTTMVLLTVTVWTNALIGLFNLLPGLPLDGGQVVESAVWAVTGSRARGMRAAGWSGRVIVGLLIIGGVVVPWLRSGDLSIFGVVIVLMIGTMLWQAASAAIRTAKVQLLAERMRITDLMTPVLKIAADAQISQLVGQLQQHVPGSEYQRFPVVILQLDPVSGNEEVIGLIDYGALSAVPRDAWQLSVTTVSRRMRPEARIAADRSVAELFTRLGQYPGDVLAVVDTSQSPHTIVGLVDPADLAGRLHV